ncbi:MAG: type II toxin-antitoxin system VapC family toxin [Chloroflexi bacterium]|nr:type II toxin-antitoxin system VapC family toxin [Chloroflexota bacterium]
MSQYVVVDASVWVSRLIEEDVFHNLCRGWLDGQRLQGVQFVAPALLLVEVAAAISRRTGDTDLARRAADALKRLPDLRLVEMGNDVVQTAVVAGAELGVRGADAFYIAIAQQLGLPLATLASDQRHRAGRVVETWEVE